MWSKKEAKEAKEANKKEGLEFRAKMHVSSRKEMRKGATEGGEEKRRERNQRRKRGMSKTGRGVGYGECRKGVISEGK